MSRADDLQYHGLDCRRVRAIIDDVRSYLTLVIPESEALRSSASMYLGPKVWMWNTPSYNQTHIQTKSGRKYTRIPVLPVKVPVAEGWTQRGVLHPGYRSKYFMRCPLLISYHYHVGRSPPASALTLSVESSGLGGKSANELLRFPFELAKLAIHTSRVAIKALTVPMFGSDTLVPSRRASASSLGAQASLVRPSICASEGASVPAGIDSTWLFSSASIRCTCSIDSSWSLMSSLTRLICCSVFLSLLHRASISALIIAMDSPNSKKRLYSPEWLSE